MIFLVLIVLHKTITSIALHLIKVFTGLNVTYLTKSKSSNFKIFRRR